MIELLNNLLYDRKRNIDKQLKNKISKAIEILSDLEKCNTVVQSVSLIQTIATRMQEARSQQGFGYAPFRTFVHATKGFSEFSNALEQIGEAICQENITKDDFEKSMNNTTDKMHESSKAKTQAVLKGQKAIKSSIARVEKEIQEISRNSAKNVGKLENSKIHDSDLSKYDRECAESHGCFNADPHNIRVNREIHKVNKEKYEKIANLNHRLAAYLAPAKQKLNELKKEIVKMQEEQNIFSGFLQYFKKIRTNTVMAEPVEHVQKMPSARY